jgi:hypothetical protein
MALSGPSTRRCVLSLNYQNLDARTRAYMVEEIDLAVNDGSIYLSNFLTLTGKRDWPGLLRASAANGSDTNLADQLRRNGRLEKSYTKRKPKGGFTTAAVPVTAPETMAEGEFSRFYARGLCRRAIEDGIRQLIVYRAKAVTTPRPGSEEKIGTAVDPSALLIDLRTSQGLEPSLGIPPGPNSGLSVRLP